MTEEIYMQIGAKKVKLDEAKKIEFLTDLENTANEIAQFNAAKEAARQSALAKLKELGLTEEEIAAL